MFLRKSHFYMWGVLAFLPKMSGRADTTAKFNKSWEVRSFGPKLVVRENLTIF